MILRMLVYCSDPLLTAIMALHLFLCLVAACHHVFACSVVLLFVQIAVRAHEDWMEPSSNADSALETDLFKIASSNNVEVGVDPLRRDGRACYSGRLMV